jgi:hypothetical protein
MYILIFTNKFIPTLELLNWNIDVQGCRGLCLLYSQMSACNAGADYGCNICSLTRTDLTRIDYLCKFLVYGK